MAVWRNSILEDYLKQPISMALREEAVLRLSAESAAVYREILVPKLGWNGKRHDMQGSDATQTHTLWSLERKPRYQEGLVKPHWNTPRLQPCEDRQLMNCTRSGLGSQGRLPEDGAWKTIDKGNTIFLTLEYIMIRYHYRTWTIDGTKQIEFHVYIYIKYIRIMLGKAASHRLPLAELLRCWIISVWRRLAHFPVDLWSGAEAQNFKS